MNAQQWYELGKYDAFRDRAYKPPKSSRHRLHYDIGWESVKPRPT